MKRDDVPREIEQALESVEVPKLYANSFSCALGIGDVAILLKNGNKAVGVVNMSFTIAKTLSIKLQELIAFLEAKSGNRIMISDEIGQMLRGQGDTDVSRVQ